MQIEAQHRRGRPSTTKLGSLLVLLLLLLSLTAGVARAGAAAPESVRQYGLVPAYFSPDTRQNWHAMCDAMDGSRDGSTAIINPGSGPGDEADPGYGEVIRYCHDQGHNLIGYVHTQYGARPLADVKADINRYYAFYRRIDGIFLDEMSNNPETRRYYRALYRHVHSKSRTNDDVVGNPGAAAATSWQLDAPVADEVVVFEGPAATFMSWFAPEWVLAKSPSEIGVLVYGAADAGVAASACDRARTVNAGLVYVAEGESQVLYGDLGAAWQRALCRVREEPRGAR